MNPYSRFGSKADVYIAGIIEMRFLHPSGQFDLTLASGRDHDCPLQTVALPAGSLRLADLGYFKVQVFEQLNRQGVWWVSRIPARAGIWQDARVMHLADWLNQQDSTHIDQSVELTAQRLPCRMLAVRVPPEVASERRKLISIRRRISAIDSILLIYP